MNFGLRRIAALVAAITLTIPGESFATPTRVQATSASIFETTALKERAALIGNAVRPHAKVVVGFHKEVQDKVEMILQVGPTLWRLTRRAFVITLFYGMSWLSPALPATDAIVPPQAIELRTSDPSPYVGEMAPPSVAASAQQATDWVNRAVFPARAVGVKTFAALTYFGEGSPKILAQQFAGLDTALLFTLNFGPEGQLIIADTPKGAARLDDLRREIEALPNPPALGILLTNDVIDPKGNKLKDPDVVERLINNPDLLRMHINELINKTQGFKIVGIDIENLPFKLRKGFTGVYLAQVQAALTKTGQELHVYVEPKSTDVVLDSNRNIRNGASAMDYGEIAKYATRVVVMMYPFNLGGPTVAVGPNAKVKDVRNVLQFAIDQGVPPKQLGMMQSVVGTRWELDDQGQRVGAGSSLRGTALENAKAVGENFARDQEGQPSFTYTEAGKRYLVYYPDAWSLHVLEQEARRLGILDTGIWAGDFNVSEEIRRWIATTINDILAEILKSIQVLQRIFHRLWFEFLSLFAGVLLSGSPGVSPAKAKSRRRFSLAA